MMFENQVLRQIVHWVDCPALDFLALLIQLSPGIAQASLALLSLLLNCNFCVKTKVDKK